MRELDAFMVGEMYGHVQAVITYLSMDDDKYVNRGTVLKMLQKIKEPMVDLSEMEDEVF